MKRERVDEQKRNGEKWRVAIEEYAVRPASSFQGNPRNWRKHPQAQRDAVAGSLRELGFIAPVIENRRTGHLIDGHERVWQALQHGDDTPVPVVVVDLPENQEHLALTVFDPIAGMAEADREILASLMDDVKTGDAALQAMIEQLAEDEGLLGAVGEDDEEPPEPQIEIADELQKKWGTELGQIWHVGKHRVICDDATNHSGDIPDVSVTVYDPPWDTEIRIKLPECDKLVFSDGARLHDAIELFGSPTWLFVWDCVSSWYTPNRPLKRMKNCLWYGDVSKYDPDGWHYGDAGERRVVTNTRGSYLFEPDESGKHLSDVYQQPITKLHGEGFHNHEKPVDWVTMLIGNCTSGVIFDPFLGSGTTAVAAERLGRVCYGMEIEPRYVAVTLERLADMGLTPKLQKP